MKINKCSCCSSFEEIFEKHYRISFSKIVAENSAALRRHPNKKSISLLDYLSIQEFMNNVTSQTHSITVQTAINVDNSVSQGSMFTQSPAIFTAVPETPMHPPTRQSISHTTPLNMSSRSEILLDDDDVDMEESDNENEQDPVSRRSISSVSQPRLSFGFDQDPLQTPLSERKIQNACMPSLSLESYARSRLSSIPRSLSYSDDPEEFDEEDKTTYKTIARIDQMLGLGSRSSAPHVLQIDEPCRILHPHGGFNDSTVIDNQTQASQQSTQPIRTRKSNSILSINFEADDEVTIASIDQRTPATFQKPAEKKEKIESALHRRSSFNQRPPPPFTSPPKRDDSIQEFTSPDAQVPDRNKENVPIIISRKNRPTSKRRGEATVKKNPLHMIRSSSASNQEL